MQTCVGAGKINSDSGEGELVSCDASEKHLPVQKPLMLTISGHTRVPQGFAALRARPLKIPEVTGFIP